MLRNVALSLALSLALPATAAPTEDWSARIAKDGLAQTRDVIAALPAPTAEDLFALGAVAFLSGIEGALQARWKVGATDELFPIPVLRVALPPNPSPAPYRAELVREIFTGILSDMAEATAALDRIADGDDLALTIRLADIWLDIDGNGTRGEGEDLMALAFSAFLNPWEMPETPGPVPVVRFDTADAAWLSAYAHLVSGLGEAILAYDPTEATARMMSAADKRRSLGEGLTTQDMLIGANGYLDKAMIVVDALRQTPDVAHARAAKQHLLAMVADNRTFWTRVARETDNEAEWLPNGSQTGAFGVMLPPETGQTWLSVLSELEAMLNGERLVPHWALPPGSGVDVGHLFDNPVPIDVLGWIHGIDALPYARKGPVIDGTAWRAFESIVAGDSLLYALWLN